MFTTLMKLELIQYNKINVLYEYREEKALASYAANKFVLNKFIPYMLINFIFMIKQ